MRALQALCLAPIRSNKLSPQNPLLKAEDKACHFTHARRHNDAMSSRPAPQPETLAALRALGYNQVPSSKVRLRGRAQTVEQVVDSAPTLAHLSAMARDTQNRLRAIAPLLPATLRHLVQSGGVDGSTWCLLVPNSAVAAKLRQTLPALCAHLRTKGWDVQTIQVKVSANR
jgi:hypothetical protein